METFGSSAGGGVVGPDDVFVMRASAAGPADLDQPCPYQDWLKGELSAAATMIAADGRAARPSRLAGHRSNRPQPGENGRGLGGAASVSEANFPPQHAEAVGFFGQKNPPPPPSKTGEGDGSSGSGSVAGGDDPLALRTTSTGGSADADGDAGSAGNVQAGRVSGNAGGSAHANIAGPDVDAVGGDIDTACGDADTGDADTADGSAADGAAADGAAADGSASLFSQLESPKCVELLQQIPRKCREALSPSDEAALRTCHPEQAPVCLYLMQQGYDIRLGEAGRSELKKEISRRLKLDSKLREQCVTKVCRLKNASVMQLLQMAEMTDCLLLGLQISCAYWTDSTRRQRGAGAGGGGGGGLRGRSGGREARATSEGSSGSSEGRSSPPPPPARQAPSGASAAHLMLLHGASGGASTAEAGAATAATATRSRRGASAGSGSRLPRVVEQPHTDFPMLPPDGLHFFSGRTEGVPLEPAMLSGLLGPTIEPPALQQPDALWAANLFDSMGGVPALIENRSPMPGGVLPSAPAAAKAPLEAALEALPGPSLPAAAVGLEPSPPSASDAAAAVAAAIAAFRQFSVKEEELAGISAPAPSAPAPPAPPAAVPSFRKRLADSELFQGHALKRSASPAH